VSGGFFNGLVDRDEGYCWTENGNLIMETLPTLAHEKSADESWGMLAPNRSSLGVLPSGILVSAARHNNFYHWWTDCLPRVYVYSVYSSAFPEFRQSRAIVPSTLNAFQKQSLDLMEVPFEEATARYVRVEELLIPCGLNYRSGQRLSALARPFAAEINTFFKTEDGGHAAPEGLLYVSREKARVRRIKNEKELLGVLAPLGFECVDLADLSVSEQISLFSRARLVISPHGAGLTNLLFSRPGTKLIEIFSLEGLHSSSYRHLCGLMEMEYCTCVGEMTPPADQSSHRKPANRDIYLEPRTISALAESLSQELGHVGAVAGAALSPLPVRAGELVGGASVGGVGRLR
jgi:capsular polysaccharide biosynthesis protein